MAALASNHLSKAKSPRSSKPSRDGPKLVARTPKTCGANAQKPAGGWPKTQELKLRVVPRVLQRSIQRILRGSPQDHDPDMIPVSPAASNPRPKIVSLVGYRLPRKVAALYQAISRTVKGSSAGNQGPSTDFRSFCRLAPKIAVSAYAEALSASSSGAVSPAAASAGTASSDGSRADCPER